MKRKAGGKIPFHKPCSPAKPLVGNHLQTKGTKEMRYKPSSNEFGKARFTWTLQDELAFSL